MKTFIYGIALIIFFFASGIERCEAGGNTLKFIAHALVKITTSEGINIYIDPGNHCPIDPDSADVILITHEHGDHNAVSRVNQKAVCRIIRSADALKDSVYQTFTIGKTTITAVPSYDDFHPISKNVGYVVETDSIKVYHGGDTRLIPEMADFAGQHINYTLLKMHMGAEAMTRAVEMIQTTHAIPIHTNYPDINKYNHAAVAPFTSPRRLIVLHGETIELTNK